MAPRGWPQGLLRRTQVRRYREGRITMAMIVGARLAENPRRGDRTTRLRPVVTDDPRLADLLSTSSLLPRGGSLTVFLSDTERQKGERNIVVRF